MKYHVSFSLDLKRNSYPGLYIALEGVDGCGKTTQAEKLKEYFVKLGRDVVVTSEPRKRDSLVGKLLKKALEEKISIPMSAFQYLYSADRVITHQEAVVPALAAGKIVITHRSFWSAIAYGVFDKAVEYQKQICDQLMVANGIFSWYHQFLAPDRTFYLKISADSAVKRIKRLNKKREIYEEKDKLAPIIKGYDWLAERFGEEIIVIDGEKSVDKATAEIISKLKIFAKRASAGASKN